VAARHADVFVPRRVALDGGLLRRHHPVAERVQAAQRRHQGLALAQAPGLRVQAVHLGAHRMGDQPVHRLHQRGRGTAFGVDADRAAQRDDAAHAFLRLLRAIEREHPAQTPADQADLAARLVMQVADLLFQRIGVLGLKAQIAAQAPGLGGVAALAQIALQHPQRQLAAHEARQQQHRMPVAARCVGQQRQRAGQQGQFQERAQLQRRVQPARVTAVTVSLGHALALRRWPAATRASVSAGPRTRARSVRPPPAGRGSAGCRRSGRTAPRRHRK